MGVGQNVSQLLRLEASCTGRELTGGLTARVALGSGSTWGGGQAGQGVAAACSRPGRCMADLNQARFSWWSG